MKYPFNNTWFARALPFPPVILSRALVRLALPLSSISLLIKGSHWFYEKEIKIEQQ